VVIVLARLTAAEESPGGVVCNTGPMASGEAGLISGFEAVEVGGEMEEEEA